jgi:thiazole tautomerase (transcriptional regulator TenI)
MEPLPTPADSPTIEPGEVFGVHSAANLARMAPGGRELGSAVPVIHAVTTDDIVARPDFLLRARDLMRALGPRGAVHLRAPRMLGKPLFELAEALVILGQSTGAWLVVNDRVDVALSAGARGVQLTSRSMRAIDAHRIAPDLAVGASVHSVEDAIDAEHGGARWLVAGHVFETASHPGVSARGTPFLAALSRAVRTPIVAIGGVLPEHVPLLRTSGAHGIAAIRGLWDERNAERAAGRYLSAYDSAGSA